MIVYVFIVITAYEDVYSTTNLILKRLKLLSQNCKYSLGSFMNVYVIRR